MQRQELIRNRDSWLPAPPLGNFLAFLASLSSNIHSQMAVTFRFPSSLLRNTALVRGVSCSGRRVIPGNVMEINQMKKSAGIALWIAGCAVGFAQPAARPEFEVATVRPFAPQTPSDR